MFYLHTFFFTFLAISSVLCAPVEKTMYDVIVEKCPSIAEDVNFKSQKLLNYCEDWNQIEKVENLTDNNQREALCLLYFNSFTQYCLHAPTVNTTLPLDILTKYSIDAVCDYAKNVSHKNVTFIKDYCGKICVDDAGFVRSVCSISYYFAHLPVKPVLNNSESKILKTEQHGNSAESTSKAVVESNPGASINSSETKLQNQIGVSKIEDKIKAEDKTENVVETPVEEKKTTGIVTEAKINTNNDATPLQNVDAEQQSPFGDQDDDSPANSNVDYDFPADNKLAVKDKSKPSQIDDSEPVNYATEMEGDSNFFTYFMILCIIFIMGYVCYHNKQKVLALILEGRKGRRQYRGRRPNSANYHKLDSNLEEAITSSCKKNTNNVIY